MLRVDEAEDRLVEGHASRDEDGEDNDSPANFSRRNERKKKAIPSGTAVSASPKLWIRSASSATEPESAKMTLCATARSRVPRD